MATKKQNNVMPKDHIEAIAAQLCTSEALEAATKAAARTESKSRYKTPKIIDQAGNCEDSMKILENNNLRPLTYKEAFINIMNNPELKEKLTGKLFYLSGEGFQEKHLHTIDHNGYLKPGGGNPEETVYTYSGSGPLSLLVLSGKVAHSRFILNANGAPETARVIVGIAK